MKISYLVSNKNQLTGPYNGIISIRDRLQISILSEFKPTNFYSLEIIRKP